MSQNPLQGFPVGELSNAAFWAQMLTLLAAQPASTLPSLLGHLRVDSRLDFPVAGAPDPVTNVSVVTSFRGVQLRWTPPGDADWWGMDIWGAKGVEATATDRQLLASVSADNWTHSGVVSGDTWRYGLASAWVGDSNNHTGLKGDAQGAFMKSFPTQPMVHTAGSAGAVTARATMCGRARHSSPTLPENRQPDLRAMSASSPLCH